MILGVNTAQKAHEMCLINDGRILAERIWQDSKNDVEKLVPTLDEMLSECGLDKSEISEIIVVSGPGSFTSLRTGVAFANALASGLGAKLYGLDTFELLKRKAAVEDILVVLNGGGLDVGIDYKGERKMGPIAHLLNDLPHGNINVISECSETQSDELRSICLEKKWHQLEEHEIQTLAESILTFDAENLQPVEIVEPVYLKKPIITESSDPWKKP